MRGTPFPPPRRTEKDDSLARNEPDGAHACSHDTNYREMYDIPE